MVPLDVDETSQWCSSLIQVPKVYGKVQLCLDPARLNKLLIRLVHRGPTLNDILPRVAGVKCLTLIDVSLGYHSLQFDDCSSYLTTFSCPFSRCSFIRVLFRVAPTSDVFQRKMNELFHELCNVLGIANDVLIAGFNELGRDHDETVDEVLKHVRKST